jgi:hypothetical protein
MYCIKCGALQEEGLRKISFRAECDSCGTSLHSCVHCKYYKIGLPNDCQVPGTDRIVDREAANFCEEFVPSTQVASKGSIVDTKKRFDDLFK